MKKDPTVVSRTGVFSGRAFGIFYNMFVIQYLMELYLHVKLCAILILLSLVVLWLFSKDIWGFFTENSWKTSFYVIYVMCDTLLSGIYSIIGAYQEDVLLVDMESSPVTVKVKVLLIAVYLMITVVSVIPNSFIMKVATKNEELKS